MMADEKTLANIRALKESELMLAQGTVVQYRSGSIVDIKDNCVKVYAVYQDASNAALLPAGDCLRKAYVSAFDPVGLRQSFLEIVDAKDAELSRLQAEAERLRGELVEKAKECEMIREALGTSMGQAKARLVNLADFSAQNKDLRKQLEQARARVKELESEVQDYVEREAGESL